MHPLSIPWFSILEILSRKGCVGYCMVISAHQGRMKMGMKDRMGKEGQEKKEENVVLSILFVSLPPASMTGYNSIAPE